MFGVGCWVVMVYDIGLFEVLRFYGNLAFFTRFLQIKVVGQRA